MCGHMHCHYVLHYVFIKDQFCKYILQTGLVCDVYHLVQGSLYLNEIKSNLFIHQTSIKLHSGVFIKNKTVIITKSKIVDMPLVV